MTQSGRVAVRERELEVVGARRQAVAHDRLHPPLAEGAAGLLVGENVLERHHLAGHFAQARLRGVDDREPLVELARGFRPSSAPGRRARRRAARPPNRAGRRRRGRGPSAASLAIPTCRRYARRAPRSIAQARRSAPRSPPAARRRSPARALARRRRAKARSGSAPRAQPGAPRPAPSASVSEIGTPSMTASGADGHRQQGGPRTDELEQNKNTFDRACPADYQSSRFSRKKVPHGPQTDHHFARPQAASRQQDRSSASTTICAA